MGLACVFNYLGGKYNYYIIAAANAVVNPVANFLPLVPKYFPFAVLPPGLMPQFLTLATQKCSLTQERIYPCKYQKKSCSCPRKAFSSEITPLICP